MPTARHDTPAVFPVTRDGGAGLTRRQTQGRLFTTPTPGVRLRCEVEPSGSVAAAIATTARPDGVLTDVSAALTWGLPLPPSLADGPDRVSLSVAAGRANPRRAGVRGRRLQLPEEHLTRLGGQLVTTPARTWIDCAAALGVPHLVAMGDAVLHRGLATPEDLTALSSWARRRRGVRPAREALALLDAAAESPGESLTRVALVTRGIPKPRCNADVIVDGQWLARVDLLWEDERVIVEYDGIVHLPEERRRADAVRRNLLQDAGYLVIVFTGRDLRHPEQMCQLVRSALSRPR